MKYRLIVSVLAVLAAAVMAACSGTPVPASNPVSAPVLVDPVAGKTVFIPGKGHEIPVALFMPEGASAEHPVPVVVTIVGTGSDKESYDNFALYLNKAGIACVNFDVVGTGESGGDYIDYSFASAVSDTSSVTAWAATVRGIDADRIGLLGWSQGGTLAILAAKSNPVYKAVGLWAAALDLSGMITPEMRSEAAATGKTLLDLGFRPPLNLGKQWIDEVDNTGILAAVPLIPAPLYVLAGSKDESVPPQNSRDIAAAAKNGASRLEIIDGFDHTFGAFSGDLTNFNVVCGKTADWFAGILK
jgi:dienelactone hydrolase